MLSLLVMLLHLASAGPQTAEAVSRAAAIAAGKDPRLDVISELDVQDTIALETQRQVCGAESESCATQLADAFDARLVLFLRLYRVGTIEHVALTLHDVKAGRIVGRGDIEGDEQALFVATQAETAAVLTAFADHSAEGRTRVFVSRATVDAPAFVVVTPRPTAGPSPLTIAGFVTGAVGVVVAGAATGVAIEANSVVGDVDSGGRDKKEALDRRGLGIIGAGVGAAVVGVGAALIVVGGME